MRRLLFLPVLFLLVLCCWHKPANATACTAGCTSYQYTVSGSGTTATVNLTGVTAGDAIRINYCLFPNTLTASSITVGAIGATISSSNTGTSGTYRCGVAYYQNSASGTVPVVLTASGTCSGCNLMAEDWHGDATTGGFDGSNAAYMLAGGIGSSLPCGNMTTAHANDVIETWFFDPFSDAVTAPSGYSTAANDYASQGTQSAYESVSSTGTYNPTWTAGVSGMNAYVICGAFPQTGGGGGVANYLLPLMGVGP